MSKTIQMKTTITEGGIKQQINGYPITTPDRVIDGDGVSVEDALSEIKSDMEDYSQIVLIQSTSSTTHSEQTVPELTVQQVIDAYNGLVAGNTVIIESATTYQNFSVIQAHGIGDLIAIYIIYNKDLILCYQVSDNSVVITSQNIGGVKMQVMTQAEFDALTTYEENTEYAII